MQINIYKIIKSFELLHKFLNILQCDWFHVIIVKLHKNICIAEINLLRNSLRYHLISRKISIRAKLWDLLSKKKWNPFTACSITYCDNWFHEKYVKPIIFEIVFKLLGTSYNVFWYKKLISRNSWKSQCNEYTITIYCSLKHEKIKPDMTAQSIWRNF